MRMGVIGCNETSVINYLFSLLNDTEERSSLKNFFSQIGCGSYQAPVLCQERSLCLGIKQQVL